MQTGENEQSLRKILDMTRLISVVILALHFYYYCYGAFEQWHLTATISDRLLGNIYRTGLFTNIHKSKLLAAAFMLISLMGARGRKDEKLGYKPGVIYMIAGLVIYFLSYMVLISGQALTMKAIIYIGLTSLGYVLILSAEH